MQGDIKDWKEKLIKLAKVYGENTKNDDRVYNLGAEQSREETLKRFDLDPAKPIFGMFTNLMWQFQSLFLRCPFSAARKVAA